MQIWRCVAASFAGLLLVAAPARAAVPALESDANKEGRVVWYTTLLEEASKPLAAAFEKRHPGIKVEVARKNGSATMRTLREETDVRWVAASPVLALSNNIGLMAGAPHPNAGMMLIEFNLSPEGQRILRDSNHIPASSKIDALDPALKKGFRSVYVNPAAALAYTERGREAYAEIWKKP